MDFFKKLFGDESSRALAEIQHIVERINAYESEMQALENAAFPEYTQKLKDALQEGKTLNDILPQAFALVREAFVRTMGVRLYDVQMIGGVVIHQGKIAEMRTGEGKTFTAVLPAYLNALSGKGVHVVSPNDYLAKRDAGWVGEVYNFLGVTVASINDDNKSFIYDESHTLLAQGGELDDTRDEEGSFRVFDAYLRPCSRKEAYDADITYGTNNQFGFDYLRDNTQTFAEGLVQRTETPHHFAIVDEIDSILIDEARVPLILSTKSNESRDLYALFARVARQLESGSDYTVDEKMKAISLTDAGIEKAEKILNIDNIYTQEMIQYVHHLETAVRAQALYLKDRDYLIREQKVLIVDPFTGRVQDGRRWSDGLHQAIEAKENVPILDETKTIASITYQNYFKFYTKLAGMTGTAKSSREEFYKVYGLDVIEVPTHRTVQRIDNIDLIFQTEQGKFKAIARKVKEIHATGQPVLIGTVSVEKNELLSAYLTQEGVPHQVLNAKNHEQEGEIIAQAGKKGAVTIATNMAGRGVDIKLGGNPTTPELEQEIREIGGLFVLGTERHDARRIDNQLRGRAGRQGDPGETQFYVSLEDPLMKVFGSDRAQAMIGALGLADDEAIQNKFISNALESAQEKIEGFNFDARKSVLSYDDVLSTQRNSIYRKRRAILLNQETEVQNLFNEVTTVDETLTQEIFNKRTELANEELFDGLFRRVALNVIDRLWMQHLQVMDHTRQSVNLRAYGQREPIVEYKKEGLRLFRELEQTLYFQIAETMSRIDVASLTESSLEQKPQTLILKTDRIIVEKDGVVKEIKEKKISIIS
ncbi:MAG: preprotein translocase subunit SecA [Candidatus Pacebacteria bacterium]|nr:preprotein translocase subunit SecA [Candidatus Paceibacterota bacterium]